MQHVIQRFGTLVVVAMILTVAPSTHSEAAACSPRLFRELGPAPNAVAPVSPPEAPTPEPVQPFQAVDPSDESPPPPPLPAEPPPDQTTPEEASVDPAPVDAVPVVPAPAVVTPPPPRCSFYYDMDHPVAGPSQTLSAFGSIRAGGDRWHAGLDIAAAKLTPVVAVRSGTVTEVNRNGSGDCCWVKIRHTDGWQSLYVHLNNDIYRADGGKGIGIVRDLRVGDAVLRGEVIGYVGDSGNAEPGVPHLHFELRTRWGESVDPLPSIRRAERRGVSGFAGLDDPPYGFSGPYADLSEDSVDIVSLGVSLGLPLACDEYGLFFCGESQADEATLLEWIDALSANRLDPSSWAEEVPELEVPVGDFGSDQIEIERLMRLCADACRESLSQQDIEDHLFSVVSLDPSTVGHLYLESKLVGCEPADPQGEPAISRLGMLELLLRAFGHLPPLPPPPDPPCDRIF
jgi:murein DD-endopeptidase MepM/ murein hydrolase activator NlpD